MLERQEYAGICPFLGAHLQKILSVEDDFTLCHLVGWVAHDDIAQCGLASTVGSHHGMNLAIIYSEVYALQYFFAIDTGM